MYYGDSRMLVDRAHPHLRADSVHIPARVWRDVAKQGHVEFGRLRRDLKEKVARAQFHITREWVFSEYDNQAEGFRTRTMAAIELDNLLAQATSVIGRFSHAAPVEMSGFESLQREIENVCLRVQNLVLHYESMKLTHPEKTRIARQATFLNWTWCIMAALYSRSRMQSHSD